MNYTILNKPEFFNDIKIKGFKKVDINGSDRVDAVFAYIDKGILENVDTDTGRGDSILPESWLLRDGGCIFILCKIERNILYDENQELIEKLFRLFNKKLFYIELWGINEQESYNQLECYLLAYNKNLGYQEIFTQDNNQEEETNILQTLIKKIEKNLL